MRGRGRAILGTACRESSHWDSETDSSRLQVNLLETKEVCLCDIGSGFFGIDGEWPNRVRRIARCEIHGIVGNVGRLEQSRLSATEIHAAVKNDRIMWMAGLRSCNRTDLITRFCVHRMPSTGVRQLTVRHINERTIRRDRMAVDAVRIILCPQHGITEQIISEQTTIALGAAVTAKADIQCGITSTGHSASGAAACRYALGLHQWKFRSVQVV